MKNCAQKCQKTTSYRNVRQRTDVGYC